MCLQQGLSMHARIRVYAGTELALSGSRAGAQTASTITAAVVDSMGCAQMCEQKLDEASSPQQDVQAIRRSRLYALFSPPSPLSLSLSLSQQQGQAKWRAHCRRDVLPVHWTSDTSIRCPLPQSLWCMPLYVMFSVAHLLLKSWVRHHLFSKTILALS